MAKKFDVTKHILVPQHSKVSDKELKEIKEKYNISILNMPKISSDDAAIQKLSVKEGDVVKIVRQSPTAGESVFYRRVSNV